MNIYPPDAAALHRRPPRHHCGFTIIEIMIAVILGLIIIAGLFKVYETSKFSYLMSENVGRMQENARFAMSKLTRDIRMAGSIPCKIGSNFANTLNDTTQTFTFLDFADGSIRGYDGASTNWPAGRFPGTGTAAGDRVAGTDAIVVLRDGGESYLLTRHNVNAQQFTVNDLYSLANGDILLACDGVNAAIFQALNVNTANKTFEHSTGAGSPGNCSTRLGGSGSCKDSNSQLTLKSHTFGLGAQLVKFAAVGYFIGVSSGGDSRSLYRRRLVVDHASSSASYASEEVLQGVENMQILYAENTDTDKQPEQYFTADNVTTWNNIVSLRIGLLMHTPDQVSGETDTKKYNLAGALVDPATSDRRMRFSFNSSVTLRNRAL